MSIKIANDTANGNVILKGQNVAGDKTITMPNIDCELAPRMQLMTAQNSTNGTSIDFTGIPSWAKKITVMFNGVSTSGTSINLVQLGDAGGIKNTGYSSSGTSITSTPAVIVSAQTAGFGIGGNNSATNTKNGNATIYLVEGNTWVMSGLFGFGNEARIDFLGGNKTLPSTLDRIRITTVNGTDTFDAGTINILVEG